MSLPSSIWVKFKDDYITVTYLGTEYALVWNADATRWQCQLSGNETNGVLLVWLLGTSALGNYMGSEVPVKTVPVISGIEGSPTVMELFLH